MDTTELRLQLHVLSGELAALDEDVAIASRNLDVDALQELLPRRSALNHAIAAGEVELDDRMDKQKREQAREESERSRAQSAQANDAQQRAFCLGAAQQWKRRVDALRAAQKNLPANGKAYEERQQQLAQTELDKLVTRWNIREEELK